MNIDNIPTIKEINDLSAWLDEINGQTYVDNDQDDLTPYGDDE